MSKSSKLFKKGGGLSDTLSHFELREGQVELSDAIDNAIENKTHLIAEAGTGIGKTFAYLLPTLSKKKKVFVSTATKHLQDQIFFKDIPIIEKVLNRRLSSCLLKGRANYFCHHRFAELEQSMFQLTTKQMILLPTIREWSQETLSGDLSEVSEFSEDDSSFLKKITSTVENCLGQDCSYFDDCFIQKVREKAKKSEIVIVNHALLMADIVLKETGFAEILPEVDVVVIDEAHHLSKVASQAFAEQISSNQLLELARDALQLYTSEANDMVGFTEAIDSLVATTKDFIDSMPNKGETTILLGEIKQQPKMYEAFRQLMQSFKIVLDGLEELSARSVELDNMYDRGRLLAYKIKTIFSNSVAKNTDEKTESNSKSEEKNQILSEPIIGQYVSLLNWSDNYFNASKIPIHLGNKFRDIMANYADSWIFVSATLTVNESFDYYKQDLGLDKSIPTLNVKSPFDYDNNAAIHILNDLPDPRNQDFTKNLVESVKPIIKSMNGRTFMLFTSYRALNEAADLLEGSEFNLFVQGDLPKSQLIDAFIQSDNSILLGTVSFWEGVDVQGDSLSCVIIDKIPFPSPADPMISEQMKYLEREGKNSFAHCFIPRAATLLKQGAGRLIRSTNDKGILIFGDNRMINKGYGQELINSMPPAKIMNRKDLFDFIDNKL